MTTEQKQPEYVVFNEKKYLIASLPAKIIDNMNFLINLEQEVQKARYELNKVSAAHAHISTSISAGLQFAEEVIDDPENEIELDSSNDVE